MGFTLANEVLDASIREINLAYCHLARTEAMVNSMPRKKCFFRGKMLQNDCCTSSLLNHPRNAVLNFEKTGYLKAPKFQSLVEILHINNKR